MFIPSLASSGMQWASQARTLWADLCELLTLFPHSHTTPNHVLSSGIQMCWGVPPAWVTLAHLSGSALSHLHHLPGPSFSSSRKCWPFPSLSPLVTSHLSLSLYEIIALFVSLLLPVSLNSFNTNVSYSSIIPALGTGPSCFSEMWVPI